MEFVIFRVAFWGKLLGRFWGKDFLYNLHVFIFPLSAS